MNGHLQCLIKNYFGTNFMKFSELYFKILLLALMLSEKLLHLLNIHGNQFVKIYKSGVCVTRKRIILHILLSGILSELESGANYKPVKW